jgi:hypothetical protein
MQCSNHLKQIGLAVHNFHDTNSGLPPSSTGYVHVNGNNDGASLWALIYPFIEQTNLYALMQERHPQLLQRYGNAWWNSTTEMNDEKRKSFGSVSPYRCPTRRGGGTLITEGTTTNEPGGFLGPQSDYAMVFATTAWGEGDTTFGAWFNGPTYSLPRNIERQVGPFRTSIRETNSWSVRETMAWWQDGTSNQFMMGEKHIPLSFLGKCSETTADTSTGDCSYLGGSGWNFIPAGRPLVVQYTASTNTWAPHSRTLLYNGGMLCRPRDFDDLAAFQAVAGTYTPVALREIHFGSYHPGICQFVLGDGSVRPIPITTPYKTLALFSVVNDGETVTLP